MKAFEVEVVEYATDFRTHFVIVAETRQEAESKVGKEYMITNIVPMRDEVTYNVRGTEEVTGITLNETWTSDKDEKVARREAKSWIGQEFKINNPKLFKKGQRVKFNVTMFVSDSRVTVEERIANISREVLVA
jgi:hypothetical protein